MGQKKSCGNCLFWKALKDEPEMGNCLRSTSGKSFHARIPIRTLPNGIAIRTKDGTNCPPLNVYFGINFRCKYYKPNP